MRTNLTSEFDMNFLIRIFRSIILSKHTSDTKYFYILNIKNIIDLFSMRLYAL